MSTHKIFHLGLCMAGSISAGAYTAGVVDYLIEALENWESARLHDTTVPDHRVVIDLLGGASGGGMTGAMTLFALMDKMDHPNLEKDGITYQLPKNNILWKLWVELSGKDVLEELLATDDVKNYEIYSALNSKFIDEVAKRLNEYIEELKTKPFQKPPFAGTSPEMFMTLFNVTGINYQLHTKATKTSGSPKPYIKEHRDIAHFRYSDFTYPEVNPANTEEVLNIQNAPNSDGRIPISLNNLAFKNILVDSCKATGAFPVGLCARLVKRPAKFIWDNPFFNKDAKFDERSIDLDQGKITDRETLYTSINADGGTANNEPVELMQNILLHMRHKVYKDIDFKDGYTSLSDTKKKELVRDKLLNTSVLMIDPFPAGFTELKMPTRRSGKLTTYGGSLIDAMRSQLLFDATDALEAYKKENYGLHVIAPSKDGFTTDEAIACGSLGGFGGFIDREFRVHDFFLGRKNCQSFLRKYFVANVNEPDPKSRECVNAVLHAYEKNPAAMKRFSFEDENKNTWVPIIPDVSLTKPITSRTDGKLAYTTENEFPVYGLKKLPANKIELYRKKINARIIVLINNIYNSNIIINWIVNIISRIKVNRMSDWVIEKINKDLKNRKLMK